MYKTYNVPEVDRQDCNGTYLQTGDEAVTATLPRRVGKVTVYFDNASVGLWVTDKNGKTSEYLYAPEELRRTREWRGVTKWRESD